MIVGIDPGHGGQETGAVAAGVLEKDLNLAIADLLSSKIPGSHVLRRGYENPTHRERCGRAIAIGANLVISVHCNSNVSSVFRGFETYAWPTNLDAAKLAAHIRYNVPTLLMPARHYTTHYGDWRSNAHAVVGAYHCTCVLVEFGYMSNKRDRRILISDSGKETLTDAVAKGIRQWQINTTDSDQENF